jgi:hypothetical protein
LTCDLACRCERCRYLEDLWVAVHALLDAQDAMRAASHYDPKSPLDCPPHLHRRRVQNRLDHAEDVLREVANRETCGGAA